MSKNKAEEVLTLTLKPNPWRPNTDMIRTHFGVSKTSAETIVRTAKKLATERGFFWGWDPQARCFRAAPSNSAKISKRMLNYTFTKASESVDNAVTAVRGAEYQGLITEKSARTSIPNLWSAEKMIYAGKHSVKFSHKA